MSISSEKTVFNNLKNTLLVIFWEVAAKFSHNQIFFWKSSEKNYEKRIKLARFMTTCCIFRDRNNKMLHYYHGFHSSFFPLPKNVIENQYFLYVDKLKYF